ncbi:MAG TPA: rhodanese-like domain-containing protein [Thiobacillaceae bacterium]|nr:rhodanese-like domain-containing protein [Thiobacillaceae bacterium]HNA82874.1 rhodanese-like domain-containing protein [Thiobacillaceae bacterium]HNF89958.1 rhodanese-like domain-containing protein [Thiobacillaceae bacterium]HNH89295.1 rhodanese-like domain-containing protein [Thiobacillaceae bacterium]HNI07956.1 rhodanese-like domain-containing protein [Thiobacillaceae bacterium]
MRQIRPDELKAWLDDPDRPRPLLLDVREPWEFERCHIEGAELLPMAAIPSRVAQLDPAREMVVICHHGVRSFHVARFLEHNGFSDVINLTGGVDAWAREVDPHMAVY